MNAEMDNIFVARRQQEQSRRNWMLISLLGVVTLVVGVMAGSAMTAKGWSPFNKPDGGNGNQVPVYVAADNRVSQTLTLNGGFSAVAKAVTPAVVTIEVKSRAKQPQFPLTMDPFHDFFNGPDQEDDTPNPRRRAPQGQGKEGKGRLVPSGLGSGVIVSPDGYILTNNHVVDEAEKVEVKLPDGREFTAKIIGTDPPSDVAVLKIDAGNLPTLTLGDSDKVEIGDIVLAVGNPLGVGQTVTMGIISAKGRSTGGRAGGGPSYEDFLQTDAPINRGNSGGALVNLNGELIGIPSQILSGTGGSIGIGFAIPTKMARNVMDQLIKNGKVRRGILGVTLNPQGLTSEVAEQFGYKGSKGALIAQVTAGSPAEKAGVKPGDIVTEFQGQRVQDNDQLRNLVSQTAPGTAVRFKIWRNSGERELTATLDELKPSDLAAIPPQENGGTPDVSSSALSGVRVENLQAAKTRGLNIPPTVRGVLVAEVATDSAAFEAGLRQNMVIEEVNHQSISSITEFNDALKKAGNKKALLRVRTRTGGAGFILVNPQE